MQQQRSPISEYIPLSKHDSQEFYSGGLRRKRNVSSQILLIVNNWHFNRDVMTMSKPTKCCPEDCSIQIKLSSSAFKGDAKGEGENYHWDKNGLVLPYSAFVWMCDEGKEEISAIMSEIQRLYNIDVLPAPTEQENDEDLPAPNEQENDEDIPAKRTKKNKK